MKAYTIQDAIDAAKAILLERYGVTQLCLDYVKKRDVSESITLSEKTVICDELVFDTLYCEGKL